MSYKGTHITNDAKKKISEARYREWSNGTRKVSPISISKLPHFFGELHHGWKGKNIGYQALHRWLRRYFKKKGLCVNCGKHCKTEWAMISLLFYRIIDDFIELCPLCHRRYDFGLISIGRKYENI